MFVVGNLSRAVVDFVEARNAKQQQTTRPQRILIGILFSLGILP
jgi:hypothetical protein